MTIIASLPCKVNAISPVRWHPGVFDDFSGQQCDCQGGAADYLEACFLASYGIQIYSLRVCAHVQLQSNPAVGQGKSIVAKLFQKTNEQIITGSKSFETDPHEV